MVLFLGLMAQSTAPYNNPEDSIMGQISGNNVVVQKK